MDLHNFVAFSKKIVGAGRNYRSLAKQQGKEIPNEPMLFLKPITSFVKIGGNIEVPKRETNLIYEVELAVIIGKNGKNIPESSALDYIGGYALALDMTSGDIHGLAKQKGHPWSVAKGYDTFCPISGFIEPSKIDPFNTKLWLKVNGELKQNGSTDDMIFTVPYLISYISRIFTLEVGDVIITGTPEGVGAVNPGQTITAGIEGVVEMSFPVIQRPDGN